MKLYVHKIWIVGHCPNSPLPLNHACTLDRHFSTMNLTCHSLAVLLYLLLRFSCIMRCVVTPKPYYKLFTVFFLHKRFSMKYVEQIKLREFLEPAWTLLGNLPFIPDHVLLLTKPHTSYCEGAKWVQCSTPNQKVVNSILTHGSFLVRDGVCCNPGRAVQYQSLSLG